MKTKPIPETPDPVTQEWVRTLLEDSGTSQLQAAQMLHVDARTMRRWCLAEVSMPWAAAELLRRLLIRRITG